MFKQTAGLVRAARVKCILTFIDVPDDAVFVHHQRCPVREPLLLVQNTVFLRNLSLEITKQRKINSFLLRESFVRSGAVNANPQDLGAGFLELGDISLIRLQLLRSAPREG